MSSVSEQNNFRKSFGKSRIGCELCYWKAVRKLRRDPQTSSPAHPSPFIQNLLTCITNECPAAECLYLPHVLSTHNFDG